MREKINQILQGNFIYETGNVEFSCSRIEIELEDSSVYEGEFSILADLDGAFNGTVTTSDSKMMCLNPKFDEQNAVIRFAYDASYMQPGDVEKGYFYVVSNQGEAYLSYVVSIVNKVPDSSMGSIRNLFHFANLAKSNWDEALSLFYKKEFESVFSGVDRKYFDAYKSLSRYPGNEQNMEEFLLHINKKQAVNFVPHTYQMEFENVSEILANEIMITRNGWGYTFLRVETDGDFLSVENSFLSGENFLGNYCKPLFYIHPEGLHGGNNYGKIIFSNNYISFEVKVCVKQKWGTSKSVRERRERQRQVVSLMDYYQAFRTKQISSTTWHKETARIVDRMLLNDETDTAARLLQAQLLITEKRVNEAKWVLDRAEQLFVKNNENDKDLYAYYLYLTALNSKDEIYVNKITGMMQEMYETNPDNFYIAWFLLFLSEEYSKNIFSKWKFLEEQFYKGSSSPLYYIEAFILMNSTPSLLTKLDEFEVQVLVYGAKRKLIGKELMRQFQYLLEKAKGFDTLLFRILESMYEVYGDDSTLTHICSMLIKGNISDKEYFKWYELGVEKNLRIIRLYEYYMLSADKTNLKQLPKTIIMYFNYNSNLDYETNAYLYACILRFSDKAGEFLDNYRPQIERFVVEQVLKGHISKNLAYLYKNVFNERMLNEEYANKMAPILFAHLIKVESKEMKYCVVKSQYDKSEEVYPVQNGQAIVYLYGSEHTISFEDGYKNRYLSSVPYVTEKLLLPAKMAKQMAPYVQECLGFDGYMIEISKDTGYIDESQIVRYERLMYAEHMKERYRHRIMVALLQYYYDNDCIEKMDEVLQMIDGGKMDTDLRCEVIRLFVLRGMTEEAYRFVCDYGVGGLDIKTLMKITSRQIEESQFVKEELLLNLAYSCFKKGKYDTNILKYLVCYFEGLSKDMRDIWQAAEAFEVESRELCQRCLEQVLYSGAYISDLLEMYKSYKKHYVEPELEHAFLAQWAYDYFVKDRLVTDYIFKQMASLYENYQWLLVEKLAYLKYFAENKEMMAEDTKEVAVRFIRSLLAENVFLPFFLEYVSMVPELRVYADKVFVEYQGTPNGKAILHYVVELGDGEGGEYCTEEMRNIYGGVYCKEFVLFYGEVLQYYIMEEVDGKSQLTESNTIQKTDMTGTGGDSRYNMLNDIAISKTMQDYETLDELIQEYYRKTYLVDDLFS